MFLTININDFDIKYIYYHKKINNIIVKNSNFIRLCYSNNILNLNAIYINFELDILKKKFINSKEYNYFIINDNINIINKICNIENNILNSININNYIKHYSLNEKIKNSYLITNTNNNKSIENKSIENKSIENKSIENNKFILKISGIWLNESKYGLIFKIFKT